MRNILKNRKALSTVVTTLIILVVSVLLAGVVTYYAINVVSTRVQQESLNLEYQHVWYSTFSNGGAEAAVMITNTGGRDVVIDKIEIRGQTVPWTNVFIYTPAAGETLGDLYYFSQTITQVASYNTTRTPKAINATVAFAAYSDSVYINTMKGSLATTPVLNPPVLKSGNTIVLYMTTVGLTSNSTNKWVTTNIPPGSVAVNDVGLTIAISVFTAQATYIKETNVNTVS
jgi:hypothetical protein